MGVKTLALFRRRRSVCSHPGSLPGRRSLLLIVALGSMTDSLETRPQAGRWSRSPEHAKTSLRRNRTAGHVIGLSRQDAVAPYALASTGSKFPAPWSSW
jgi:hypothetical protein